MAATVPARYPSASNPVHLLLVGASLAFFVGALLSDVAYWRSYEIQWQNFASWFIVGALVFGGAALVCALLALLPARRTRGRALHAIVLAATWVFGFFNALMHARDAWASMPGGLVLSVITVVLGIVAAWLAVSPPRIGGVE